MRATEDKKQQQQQQNDLKYFIRANMDKNVKPYQKEKEKKTQILQL